MKIGGAVGLIGAGAVGVSEYVGEGGSFSHVGMDKAADDLEHQLNNNQDLEDRDLDFYNSGFVDVGIDYLDREEMNARFDDSDVGPKVGDERYAVVNVHIASEDLPVDEYHGKGL